MGDSSPASYIRMVQYFIEKCLLLNMNKEQCMEALSKNTNIQPVITSTVWKELEKENKEFFDIYNRGHAEHATDVETQKMLSETVARTSNNHD